MFASQSNRKFRWLAPELCSRFVPGYQSKSDCLFESLPPYQCAQTQRLSHLQSFGLNSAPDSRARYSQSRSAQKKQLVEHPASYVQGFVHAPTRGCHFRMPEWSSRAITECTGWSAFDTQKSRFDLPTHLQWLDVFPGIGSRTSW